MSMGSLGDSYDDSHDGENSLNGMTPSGGWNPAWNREPAEYPAWRALKAATGKNKTAFSIRDIVVTLLDPHKHDAGVKLMLDAICSAVREIGDLLDPVGYTSVVGVVNFADRVDIEGGMPGFTVRITQPIATNLVMWQTVDVNTLATIWHVRHNTTLRTRSKVVESSPGRQPTTEIAYYNPFADEMGKESRRIDLD